MRHILFLFAILIANEVFSQNELKEIPIPFEKFYANQLTAFKDDLYYLHNIESTESYQVYKLSGNTWSKVGNIFKHKDWLSASSMSVTEDAIFLLLHTNEVERSAPSVFTLKGTEWVPVGELYFTPGYSYCNQITTIAGKPYINCQSTTYQHKQVIFSFQNNKWKVIGDPCSKIQVHNIEFGNYNNHPAIFFDNNDKSVIKYHTGNNWKTIYKEPIDLGQFNKNIHFKENEILYCYSDKATGYTAKLFSYNGKKWIDLGSSQLATKKVDFIDLFNHNGEYIATYFDKTSQTINMIKYKNGKWSQSSKITTQKLKNPFFFKGDNKLFISASDSNRKVHLFYMPLN